MDRLTSLPVYPRGNSPRYPLYRRLVGSQIRCAHYGEEKHLLSLPVIVVNLPARSQVCIPTELSRIVVPNKRCRATYCVGGAQEVKRF
jgi:hypothetical protein